MSYVKTTWEDFPSTNTPITATRLNNIENGIKGNEESIEDLSDSLSTVATSGSYNDLTDKPTTPSGLISVFAGSVAPDGWLICDGSEISRTTYANLFAVIGTTYGSGDDSTTFNLPNLKGRIPVGLDNSDTSFNLLAKTGGEKEHTLTINEMPSHSHKLPIAGSAGDYQYLIADYVNNLNRVLLGETGTAGGGQAHNILQPYIVMNYIISY